MLPSEPARRKKIVLAGVPGVALRSDLDEILHTWPLKQEESHCNEVVEINVVNSRLCEIIITMIIIIIIIIIGGIIIIVI